MLLPHKKDIDMRRRVNLWETNIPPGGQGVSAFPEKSNHTKVMRRRRRKKGIDGMGKLEEEVSPRPKFGAQLLSITFSCFSRRPFPKGDSTG